MTNKQIKLLFEKKLENKEIIYFKNWLELYVCSKEEMNMFIKFLNELSEKSIIKYIKKDPTILGSINNQTEKMCVSAIKFGYSFAIEYINNQTIDLCKLSVNQNPWSIKYVREQTVDLCLLALGLHRDVYIEIKIVSNPNYSKTLKNLKKKKAILEALT